MTCHATGRELLRQAIYYALPSADLVTPSLLCRPTPCAGWNLGMLLSHLSESLDALAEGLDLGSVGLAPPATGEPDAGPAGIRVRCGLLLGALRAAPPGRAIAVNGYGITEMALTCTGAIEVSVHGWDVAAACGTPRAIPDGLAGALLRVAPALLPGASREGLFADPLPVGAGARPGDRLLAFLGRAS